MSYQTKQCSLAVKDLDTRGRTVVIYVSAFGNKDSDGDIILPGAFKKTIAESGPKSYQPRIKHLMQHKHDRLIGKPLEMVEDSRGLLVTSLLADTTEGRDALKLYEMDLLEHSIGYQVPPSGQRRVGDANHISEIYLREYSSVSWGANSSTPLVGIKSLSKTDQLAVLRARVDRLSQACNKGSFTDETSQLLKLNFKQIKQEYQRLSDPDYEARELIECFRQAIRL